MGNMRNTVAYFKKQVAPTTSVVPTSDTDGWVAIEKPDVTTGQKELLESDLLSGNIGKKKPQLGIESAAATIATEVRSHGDAANPTEPDFGALFESAVGTPNISTAEAVQAVPAPSDTEFGILTEGNIKKLDMLIVDNATDGRVVRFVKSMKIDVVLGLNDAVDVEDGGGEENATLTPGTYLHGGSALAGSIGLEIKTRLEALPGFGDVVTVLAVLQKDGSFEYTISSDGSDLDLLLATGANQATAFLKLNLGFGAIDLIGTSHTAATKVFGNRVVLNVAMTTAPTAADVVFATVNYKPLNEGHKHLTAGFFQGNSDVDGYLEKVVGALVSSLGITIETGAVAKFNFEVQGLLAERDALTKAPFDPDYEDVQGLVAFNTQVFLNAVCLDANNFSLSLENDISERKSFKEANGKIGSIARERNITGTVNPYADGSVTNYNALQNLDDLSMMAVIGKKDAGGFIVGQTVAVYLPQIMLTQDKTGEVDDNIIEDIAFTAHTGSGGTETEFAIGFG